MPDLASLRDWADEHFYPGRCPRCSRTIQIEVGCLAECSCGWEQGEGEDLDD